MAKRNNPPPTYSSYVLEMPRPPSAKSTDYIRSYKSWVYTCITAIAQEVATIDLHLYKRKYVGQKVEIEEVTQHEALSVLQHTNDFMTQMQLVEITQTYLELMGEGYIVKLRDDQGRVTELWALRPDWVKIIPSKDNFIAGYKYNPSKGMDSVTFPVEDVIPFKTLNPEDAYRGQGVVQGSAMAIDIDEFSSEWMRKFFYNNAMPSYVFSTDKKLKDAEIDRFMASWKSAFAGVNNSHKIAFVGGGLKPEPLTNSPADMQLLEQRKMMRDEILAMFKVPKSVIGITEDVNRANADATIRAFIERVVKPRMIRYTGFLNEFYLTEWADEDLFFDFTDPSPADRVMDLKVYESGLSHGWMTINEVRTHENLVDVDGGDDIYLPFSMQPISSTGDKVRGFFGKKGDVESGVIKLTKPETKAEQKFTINIPTRRLQDLRNESLKKDIKHDLKKLVSNYIVANQSKTPDAVMTPEKRETYWKAMIAKTDVLEQRMMKLLHDRFEEQYDDIIEKLERVKFWRKDHRKGTTDQYLFNEQEEAEKWLKIFMPFIGDVAYDKARDVYEFLGLEGTIDMSTEEAIQFLKREGAEFIKQVNATTKEALKETLAEGLGEGESIPQLKTRVSDVFETATDTRAKTIARTEILRATNWAALEAYRQSEVVVAKEWLAELDERTCQICQPMDGTIVSLGKNFETSAGSVDAPPIHPNCRCTTIPVIGKKSASSTQGKGVDVDKLYARVKEKELENAVTEAQETVKDVQEESTKVLDETKQRVQEMETEKKEEVAQLKKDAITQANTEADTIRKEAETERDGLMDKTRKEVEALRDKALNLFK